MTAVHVYTAANAELNCIPSFRARCPKYVSCLVSLQVTIFGTTGCHQIIHSLPQANYHWYRRQPNQNSWVLIESATGTTYVPASIDVGQQVMVVAVVKQNGAVKRLASAPVGPMIQP